MSSNCCVPRRARGLTTIAVLHDLNAAARFADTVALMHAGKLLACGPPTEMMRADLLGPAFRVDLAVQRGPDGHPIVVPLRAMRG